MTKKYSKNASCLDQRDVKTNKVSSTNGMQSLLRCASSLFRISSLCVKHFRHFFWCFSFEMSKNNAGNENVMTPVQAIMESFDHY